MVPYAAGAAGAPRFASGGGCAIVQSACAAAVYRGVGNQRRAASNGSGALPVSTARVIAHDAAHEAAPATSSVASSVPSEKPAVGTNSPRSRCCATQGGARLPAAHVSGAPETVHVGRPLPIALPRIAYQKSCVLEELLIRRIAY